MKTNSHELDVIDIDVEAVRRINDVRNLEAVTTPRPGYDLCVTKGGYLIEKRPNRKPNLSINVTNP